MRLPALLVALAATAGLLAGVPGVRPVAQTKECVRPHGPLIGYGHSYLRSPGIGGATASYVTLAAAALGVKPVIRAVNGGTTVDVDRLVHNGPTRWVPGSSDIVVIDSAINDIAKRLPTQQWTAALRHTLRAFAVHPVPVILLVRPLPVTAPWHPGHDPKVIAAYARAQREVAKEFSAVHIVDASDGWNLRLDLSADGVHPTPAGELALAKAVHATAARLFCEA